MKQLRSPYGYLLILALLNTALALYAIPISDLGDAFDYLALAKSFLGHPGEYNLAHRSPLYSMLLAAVLYLFQAPLAYKLVVFIQYLMVGASAWMSYRIFSRLFLNEKMAMLCGLLFNLSIATIYYANLLFTETLAVFLTVLALFLLIVLREKGKIQQAVWLGVAVGLLSLARFNAVPLIFTFLFLVVVALLGRKTPAGKWVGLLGVFLLPYALIINAWCFYNLQVNGFYGLFPHSGQGISRNITVASIRPNDQVSAVYQPVLTIFVEARNRYVQSAAAAESKGSMAKLDKYGLLTDLYGGYLIYMEARPELCRHFQLPLSASEYTISGKLAGFYREIIAQNKGFILKFRFISLLSSFRASASGALPPEYGNTNLNVLPALVFKAYKFFMLLVSLLVFIAFFFFAANGIRQRWRFDFYRLAIFALIFSFWGINFAFVTAADANRFKYPAEPLILGLFVYYTLLIANWISAKFRTRHAWSGQIASK